MKDRGQDQDGEGEKDEAMAIARSRDIHNSLSDCDRSNRATSVSAAPSRASVDAVPIV
jgi:hypothetical protein